MNTHAFIFTPGHWIGQGIITFSMADDVLHFEMEWEISPALDDKIEFVEKIQVEGFPEPTINRFCVYLSSENTFQIDLENDAFGKIQGKGVFSPTAIAWEFIDSKQAFEGMEIYELQEGGVYSMRAEFTAGEGLRTFITGSIKPI